MKKGALASGALALGLSSTGNAAAQQQASGTALMFADDFVPGGTFQVVGSLESTLTLNLLQSAQDGIPSPGNYNGYVINYTFTPIPKYAFLFVTGDTNVQDSSTYQFGTDANYFTGELNLVEIGFSAAGAVGSENDSSNGGTDNETS